MPLDRGVPAGGIGDLEDILKSAFLAAFSRSPWFCNQVVGTLIPRHFLATGACQLSGAVAGLRLHRRIDRRGFHPRR